MDYLEEKMQNEATELLQHNIRTNGYIEEVAEIAIKILHQRNAEVPIPETLEEAEVKYEINNRASFVIFLLFGSYVLVLYFGQYTFLRFVILTIALIFAIRYTLSWKRRK